MAKKQWSEARRKKDRQKRKQRIEAKEKRIPLSDYIKQQRKARGITQTNLAAQINVSGSSIISGIERHNHEIKDEVLFNICKVLKLDVKEVFTFAEQVEGKKRSIPGQQTWQTEILDDTLNDEFARKKQELIGCYISQRRKMRGIIQPNFATQIGIPKVSQLISIERGYIRISDELLFNVCKVLKLDVNEVFTFVEKIEDRKRTIPSRQTWQNEPLPNISMPKIEKPNNEPITRKEFGEYIKEACRNKYLTKDQLTIVLSLNEKPLARWHKQDRTIHDIQCGLPTPPIPQHIIHKLCETLDLNEDYVTDILRSFEQE